MKKFRRSSIGRLLSFLAMMAFILTSAPVTLFAQGASSSTAQSLTKIKHEPIKYFVAGKRIKIAAEVTDPEGIKLVRCYFKGKEQADFVFVAMIAGGNTYTAILPAAAQTAASIDYLFLAVNNKNQVVKTQQFRANKDDSQPMPPWQDVAMEGQLNVSTELAQAPAVLEGFADSIAMDVVESAVRFGFVVGEIYTATQIAAAGSATGTAATATSAGTVTAATGTGLSTAAIVGIAAGAVAVGGVAAAGSKGGSSSGGGGGGGSSSGPAMLGSSCSEFCSQWPTYMPGASCSCSGTNTANAYSNTRLSTKCPANGWGVTASGWTTGIWSLNYFSSGYSSAKCTFSGNDAAFTNCVSSIASAMASYCAP